MSKSLYARLARQSIRKNGRFYRPYILTVAGTAAALYMMDTTLDEQGIGSLAQFSPLQVILSLGLIVVAVLCGMFLLYTNSFLMKQRGREFGLYCILGMSKRNITQMLWWETIYTALLGLGGGLAAGMLLDRLLLLVLGRLIDVTVSGPTVYWSCALRTAGIVAALLLVIFLINSGRIHLSQPVAMLRGQSAGEREPKARWLLALLGAASLGAGYYIAVTTQSPLDAINLFFVAVLLVILGTFLLFLAGSVAVLKLLRRRKKYYYQTRHFIAVSGLMYRMRRNAAGLAVICILSTAVLVMLSSTVSLYASIDDAVGSRFPRQVMGQFGSSDETIWQPDVEAALDYVRAQGYHPENVQIYRSLSTSAYYSDGRFLAEQPTEDDEAQIEAVYFITPEAYEAATGQTVTLADGQALVKSGRDIGDTVSVFGCELSVAGWMEENEITTAWEQENASLSALLEDNLTELVVTETDLEAIQELIRSAYGYTEDWEKLNDAIRINVNFDLPDGESAADALDALRADIRTQVDDDPDDGVSWADGSDDIETSHASYAELFGGLLYLGLFLGALFLGGAGLIIYYKQISEGYEDQGRFEIMRKVGMDRPAIAGAIRSQILLVFFLPLGTALVHMAVACPMLIRLLRATYFDNTRLFLLCAAACAAVFAVIYTAVYAVTARTYYKIVSR